MSYKEWKDAFVDGNKEGLATVDKTKVIPITQGNINRVSLKNVPNLSDD